jgi:hypothetical protein
LAERVQVIITIEESRPKRMRGHTVGDNSYVQLLFNSSVEVSSQLIVVTVHVDTKYKKV